MKYVKKNKEIQDVSIPKISKETSAGGTFEIKNNRSMSPVQRKLLEHSKGDETIKKTNIPQKRPKGSIRFQQIATAMGEKHGVDTSVLKATHNSNFPLQLNAEATIQGSNIHFGPGKDTDYNIKHEVAHAIDNTLYGTPKGNSLVNGHLIDTTRELEVDKVARDIEINTNIKTEAKSNANDSQRNAKKTSIQALKKLTPTEKKSSIDVPEKRKIQQPKGKTAIQLAIGSGKISEANVMKRTYKEVIELQIQEIGKKIGEENMRRMEVIKEPTEEELDNEAYFVSRTSRFMKRKKCLSTVFEGQMLKRQGEAFDAGKGLPNGATSIENVVNSNKEVWREMEDKKKIEMLFLHKADSELIKDSTLIQSTSWDVDVLFGLNNEFKGSGKYTLVMLIALTDDDIAYKVNDELENTNNPLIEAMYIDGKGNDNEKEISVIGGIKGESIKWAAIIEE